MPTGLINRRTSQRKVGSPPKKILVLAEGGEIYTSGSYKIHVFTSTTSFRVFYKSPDFTGDQLFDYLVFAGGNGGAAGSSGNLSGPGGGGDGGYGGYHTSSFSASLNLFNKNTLYTVTVGGAGSHSTIATNSTTITSNLIGAAGGFGVGSNLNGNPGSVPSTTVRSIMTSIPSGFGPYPRVGGKEGYGFGGGGGGSGTGTGGGGGRSTEGSSSTSGNGGGFGSINGVNGAVNSSDGGGGGAGGAQGSPLPGNPNPPGGSGGLGGSGIVFIKYLFEK